MKKSKKLVLAGLVLLAITGLLVLAGCKTEVDIPDSQPCSHQPEADDGNCLTEVRCNNCDVVTTEAREAHEGGTPTCIGQACEVCGTFYGDKDENNHIKTSEVAYYYTWSETAPTSTKNYTCLYCGKAIEETASPSVWSVGDKVTYVAKDGNSYVSTVGEVTDGKAVLVSDNVYSVMGKYNETALLALLEPVGARFLKNLEIDTTIITWLDDILADGKYSVTYVESQSAYKYIYKTSSGLLGFGNISNAPRYTRTWIYRYVWDVEFTTAE